MGSCRLNEIVKMMAQQTSDDFTCGFRIFHVNAVYMVTYIYTDLYEGLSGLGLFGIIAGLPTLYEYYGEYKSKKAEEERVRRDRDASTERNFSDTVQVRAQRPAPAASHGRGQSLTASGAGSSRCA